MIDRLQAQGKVWLATASSSRRSVLLPLCARVPRSSISARPTPSNARCWPQDRLPILIRPVGVPAASRGQLARTIGHRWGNETQDHAACPQRTCCTEALPAATLNSDSIKSAKYWLNQPSNSLARCRQRFRTTPSSPPASLPATVRLTPQDAGHGSNFLRAADPVSPFSKATPGVSNKTAVSACHLKARRSLVD